MRALSLALLIPAALQAQAPLGPTVDAVVERVRKDFDVPGIAVAVVKDGKVVHLKGYGVRKLGDAAPVTPGTLFGIASNTKVFTALAVGLLVEEGRLAWDDRVVDRLPGFQMSDPYVTREMRIRDLFCHRSGLGLGAGDLMYFPPSDLTDAQVLERLRHVPLATSFRSAYAYDNILYSVAGELIRHVSGKPWDLFVQERILKPAGLARTGTSVMRIPPSEDLALPHAKAEGRLVARAHESLDNNAPAGALVSSAEDMAAWVKILLERGDLGGGKRLYSEGTAAELERPLTLLPGGTPPEGLKELRTTMSAYALGLQVQDFRGHRMVWHTGGLPGMVTRVTLLPDEKAAVVVLTNQEVGAAFSAVTYTALDHLLGAPPKDWAGAYLQVWKERQAKAAEAVAKASAARNAASKPSLNLEGYAGRYRDPWYGDVVVEAKEGRLRIRFTHTPALRADLDPWQYDTFVARWPDRSMDADAFVTFQLDAAGKVERVRMKAVSPSTDFSYDFQDLDLRPAPKDSAPR
jgi:CubicO group peptidase (beta-lactamase class C family)